MKGLTLGSTLVRLDEEKRPQPELATDWESSDNAKKWVFTLREGVEFHDGRPFAVEDAVWSLRRHMGEGSTSPAKTFLEDAPVISAALVTAAEISDCLEGQRVHRPLRMTFPWFGSIWKRSCSTHVRAVTHSAPSEAQNTCSAGEIRAILGE